jgi:hypothetical protein
VASLAELRSFYQRICARKLPVKMAANHGASLAFYFDDPDGNMPSLRAPRSRPLNVAAHCLAHRSRRSRSFKTIGIYALEGENSRNGILRTPRVNPPRKQRMSLRPRSVTYRKSFLRGFTREERYLTCVNFRFLSSALVHR